MSQIKYLVKDDVALWAPFSKRDEDVEMPALQVTAYPQEGFPFATRWPDSHHISLIYCIQEACIEVCLNANKSHHYKYCQLVFYLQILHSTTIITSEVCKRFLLNLRCQPKVNQLGFISAHVHQDVLWFDVPV